MNSYCCVTDIAGVQKYLGGSKLIALDIETSPHDIYRGEPKAALDAHKSDITGVSLSAAEGTGIYIPLRHRAGINADLNVIIPWIAENIMRDRDITLICHNLAFEAAFFYALDIVPDCKVYDTITAAQLTLKNGSEFRKLAESGLKTLAPELLGIELPDFESVTMGRHFDELDPQDRETVRYACADSDCALRLYHIFNEWFDRWLPKHRYIVESVESPAAVYVGMMKYNGICVDRDQMAVRAAECGERLSRLRDEIAFIIGDVNIGANANTSAFKEYLYKDLELPVLKTTAKYQEAADEETFVLLKEWCRANKPEMEKLFDFVIQYREIGKINSTYIEGYLKHINEATGEFIRSCCSLARRADGFPVRIRTSRTLKTTTA